MSDGLQTKAESIRLSRFFWCFPVDGLIGIIPESLSENDLTVSDVRTTDP